MTIHVKRICYCRIILVCCCMLSHIFFYGQGKNIKVIELRNYLLKAGQRDRYIDSFETKLIDTLNAYGNYVLGQYTLKDAPDNFLWIRGFDDMPSRKLTMNRFFTSDFWAKHNHIPRPVLNYSNVYLLKPLDISPDKNDSNTVFNSDWFAKPKGIAVIDFYIANDMLPQLIDFMKNKFDSVARAAGVKDISYWVSELQPNNYPDLPVFQDKNLLLIISFYKNEEEYKSTLRKMGNLINKELRDEMLGIITTKTNWVLYPTKRFSSKSGTGFLK